MSKKAQSLKARAYGYYLKGLTNAEIAKLLDISTRTVEGYSQVDRWRENVMPIRERIYNLKERGFKVREVAERVGLSTSTVERNLRAYREELAAMNDLKEQ